METLELKDLSLDDLRDGIILIEGKEKIGTNLDPCSEEPGSTGCDCTQCCDGDE